MLERLSWERLVLELVLCCIPAFILNAFFGYLPQFLLTSVTGLLIQRFWNLLRLSQWLRVNRGMTPPPERGSWEPLLYGLHQIQLRSKKRRRELGGLIKRFRSRAESLPDAVVLTTEEGGIFWCNRSAQQVLGLRWSSDSGQNIPNLLRYPKFTQYLKARGFSRPISLVLNTGRHLEIRVMPYTDKQLLMMAHDVTQMHQLEGSRRSFFANASHELHTPLTVLQGRLKMMQEYPLEGTTREEALHTMCEQTYRMEGLAKQLLTLSKIEAAPTLQLNEKVDVPTMLHMIGHEAQALGQHKHTFTFDVDNSLNVRGNEEQLRNTISDLVYNAVNHTPTGAHITVRWQHVAPRARSCVGDNGPGTTPGHIPRLTGRLYRMDKARPRQVGGSGLGLTIVKHALRHHDSRLDIESEPGKGTRFSFMIPERLIAKSDG